MVWAASTVIALGSTAVGAGASLYGSSRASKAQGQATRDASNTAAQAQRDSADYQLQANRESIRAQTEAQDKSIAFQQSQSNLARKDQEPWRTTGAAALARLGTLTGVPGTVPRPGTGLTGSGGRTTSNKLDPEYGALLKQSDAFAKPFKFEADPGYAFRQSEGMKGLTNSAAARGGLLSGAALKAASQYNQNFASNEFGNAYGRYQADQTGKFNRDQTNQTNTYNRLASIAGVGQTAANQSASAASALGSSVGNGMMQTGQNIGNSLMNTGQNIGAGMMSAGNQIASNQIGAGNARASGYLAQGNALQGMINQGISQWNGYNQMQNAGGWNAGGGNYDSEMARLRGQL